MRTCRFLLNFDRLCEKNVVSCSALQNVACECGAMKMSGGGWGARSPSLICKISNKMAKRYFLLNLANDLLAQKLAKKMSGGVGGGRNPSHLQNIS